jgi:hypothetical protein
MIDNGRHEAKTFPQRFKNAQKILLTAISVATNIGVALE